ncbi:hypothetical protein ACYSUO_23225 [Streptomyces sp. UC4497]
MADGVRCAKERDEWAKEAFPAAYERLKVAAEEVDASPFIELVAEQGEDLGR